MINVNVYFNYLVNNTEYSYRYQLIYDIPALNKYIEIIEKLKIFTRFFFQDIAIILYYIMQDISMHISQKSENRNHFLCYI